MLLTPESLNRFENTKHNKEKTLTVLYCLTDWKSHSFCVILFVRIKDVSNSTVTSTAACWVHCWLIMVNDFLQVYPDTVRYELVVEGRNHTIYLEKNRFIKIFFK